MAKTVRMRSQISGTRDGVNWPKPGGTIEVSDEEAALLIRNGQADEPDAPADAPEETATLPEGETATKPRGRRPVKSAEAK